MLAEGDDQGKNWLDAHNDAVIFDTRTKKSTQVLSNHDTLEGFTDERLYQLR